MIANIRDLRSDVRTAFSNAVNYEIISPEEYYLVKEKTDSLSKHNIKKLKIAHVHSDNISEIDSDSKTDDYDNALVKFLVEMDEKLDRILSMLSINEPQQKTLTPELLLNQGRGNNISASGISIFTPKPATNGHIIHMNINVCKFPKVQIDAYGLIVRVTSIQENNIQMYNLGIKFIDLDEKNREKIVAYVFSKQREALRSGDIHINQHTRNS